MSMKKVTNPFDGSVVGEVPTMNMEQAEEALQTAYGLYRDKKKWIPLPQRLEILKKAASIVESRIEDLTMQAAKEGGKPYMDSKVELVRAVDGILNCVEVMRTEPGSVIPMGVNAASANRLAFTQKEPIGVVVAVSAFNHPFNLIVHQVGPAIAAGCPVIVKPASDTPLSCKAFLDILYEAGLPKEWARLAVTASHDVGTFLVTDRRVGFFSFIGSPEVGWNLHSKLAPGARAALEHGGAAPVVLCEDAPLNEVLPLLCKGGFYHAGQVCVSVQRVYCHNSILEKASQGLAELANKLKVGPATEKDTEVGPLIRNKENDRVAEWVKEAIDGGAKALCGAEKFNESCYKPTVLVNPPDSAKVSTQEVFGPVVCFYGYDDIDDAIRRANSLDVSFQAAVFTKNIDKALYVYKQIDAATVMVNDHTAFRVDWMPFKGLKHSGLGVGGIPYTIHEMQVDKMMVMKSTSL